MFFLQQQLENTNFKPAWGFAYFGATQACGGICVGYLIPPRKKLWDYSSTVT